MTKEHMFCILEHVHLKIELRSVKVERFVLAGKAKTVFQMIELMARGEETVKRQKAAERKIKLMKESYHQTRSL